MTAEQARYMLRELVRLNDDRQRYQRALSALATVQEVRTSAADGLSRLAFDAHRRMIELEEKLVRLLSGATDVLSSAGEIDLDATSPRV